MNHYLSRSRSSCRGRDDGGDFVNLETPWLYFSASIVHFCLRGSSASLESRSKILRLSPLAQRSRRPKWGWREGRVTVVNIMSSDRSRFKFALVLAGVMLPWSFASMLANGGR